MKTKVKKLYFIAEIEGSRKNLINAAGDGLPSAVACYSNKKDALFDMRELKQRGRVYRLVSINLEF